MNGISSYLSRKVRVASSGIAGKGLFACEPIEKDEVIAIKGGHVIDAKAFFALPDECKSAALQISDELYIAPIESEEIPRVMVYVNHSCEPNVGLRGQLATVAMRNIKPGEELTGDYCIAYSNNFFQFPCTCNSRACRGVISSDDWKISALQMKYKGYFCQYVEDKIKNSKIG